MNHEKIEGFVKSYRYRNEENGYAIATLETLDQQKITIVGYFPVFNEEIRYAFEGDFVMHPTYGQQFKVVSYEQLKNQSKEGLIQYLSSSFFTGIGEKTATKIVALLGEDAIEKILTDKEVLAPILNPLKRLRLYVELEENQTTDHIMVALYGYGLSGKVVMKLLGAYGLKTLEALEEDPYRLMYEIDGFGFIRAHEIATKMGLSSDDIRSVKAAIVYILNTHAFSSGNLYLYSQVIEEEVNKLLKIRVDTKEAYEALIKEGKIILESDRYFLAASYYAEINLATKIKKLMVDTQLDIDMDLVDTMLSQIAIQKSMDYTEKQVEAIKTAMQQKVVVITGGPGTGKTTLIDGFLSLYANYYKISLDQKMVEDKIALMAPTGRAAKRMKELLNLNAKTIHRHLGYDFTGESQYDAKRPLPHRLIIIDEASMIDVFLANRLFEAISEQAQVIIVGDEDQLPSVGPGYVLGDLISSGIIPTVKLNEIHRQAKDSHIISLARHVNMQNLSNDDLMTSSDVTFYRGDLNAIKRVILSQIQGALKKGYSLYEDIQVLIPMYKGEVGIDLMNQVIQKQFNPLKEYQLFMKFGDKQYYENDKVIQLVNDPERGIMNGDIGIVKTVKKNDKNVVHMIVSFDEVDVVFEQRDLETLNLAYVISIHKSQGSEYPIVFLPIVKPYIHMLKKELIYTAMTRAKQHLLVLGDLSLLVYATNQLVDKRQTMLKERLIKPISDDISEEEIDEVISPYDFM